MKNLIYYIYLVEFNPQGEVQRKVLFGGAGEECIVKLLEDKDGYNYKVYVEAYNVYSLYRGFNITLYYNCWHI